jgi:hypothetical protein
MRMLAPSSRALSMALQSASSTTSYSFHAQWDTAPYLHCWYVDAFCKQAATCDTSCSILEGKRCCSQTCTLNYCRLLSSPCNGVQQLSCCLTSSNSSPAVHACVLCALHTSQRHAQKLLMSPMVLPVTALQYGKGLTLIDPDVGRTVLCMLWLLVEPIRLSAGFYGNLQENVRHPQQRPQGACTPVAILISKLCPCRCRG